MSARDRTFVTEERGGNPRRYCDATCRQHGQRERGKVRVRESAAIAVNRLKQHQDAVEAFCRSCSDGICPDATCALRPVSPYPLGKGQDLLFRERVA